MLAHHVLLLSPLERSTLQCLAPPSCYQNKEKMLMKSKSLILSQRNILSTTYFFSPKSPKRNILRTKEIFYPPFFVHVPIYLALVIGIRSMNLIECKSRQQSYKKKNMLFTTLRIQNMTMKTTMACDMGDQPMQPPVRWPRSAMYSIRNTTMVITRAPTTMKGCNGQSGK